jgi:hypothetical protein
MSEKIPASQVRAWRSPDDGDKVIVEIGTADGASSYVLPDDRARDLLDSLKHVVPGLHPMYRVAEDKAVLAQGDLISGMRLRRSGALKGHQDYFAKRRDFSLFCVMTQTCDLQPPRYKEYITLAVVRALHHAFDQQSVKNSDARRSTTDILGRIIEHQQNNRDFFYLHPEPKFGIKEDSVVDLRVMFSLSSKLHYAQIVKSRIVGMNELYAANLGWMAGNVFARVAMPPWEKLHPTEARKDRLGRLVTTIQEKSPENWRLRDRPMKRK